MGKFKRGMVQEIAEKKALEENQEKLKKKHHIETDKIIVEKNNMVKFAVRTLAGLIRILSGCILLVLAVAGIMSLVYPGPRRELFKVLLGIYVQLGQYLPFLP